MVYLGVEFSPSYMAANCIEWVKPVTISFTRHTVLRKSVPKTWLESVGINPSSYKLNVPPSLPGLSVTNSDEGLCCHPEKLMEVQQCMNGLPPSFHLCDTH